MEVKNPGFEWPDRHQYSFPQISLRGQWLWEFLVDGEEHATERCLIRFTAVTC